jgi:hypothetical protein
LTWAGLFFECHRIQQPSVVFGKNLFDCTKVSAVISKILGPFIQANYRPIAAAHVARTLLARTPSAEGRGVVLSGEMQRS